MPARRPVPTIEMAFLAIARRQENWKSTGRRRDLHLRWDVNACQPLSVAHQQR